MVHARRDGEKEQYWRRLLERWQASQPTTVRAFCAGPRDLTTVVLLVAA